MSHDLDAVTARWQRRNPDQRFRFALFAEFAAGEMLPGTFVYDRLRLAVALQGVWHALRNEMLGLMRRVRR